MFDCSLSVTEHICLFSFYESHDSNFSLSATGSCSAINHWLSLLSSYSVQLTDLTLSISEHETDETLEGIDLFFHALESLSIDNSHSKSFSLVIKKSLISLSLTKCILNSEITSSLIHSLLSQDYKLDYLFLDKCTISTANHTYMYQFSSFTLQHTNACLNATGSCSEINHWLLQLSSYTKLRLTEFILQIEEQDSSPNETLENISLYHDVLGILRFKKSNSFVLNGQQQNNVHTLSLYDCNFSSKDISLLILYLKSPHCRLHKLVLYCCTIPTTDRTLLITAIVSSTTITHLLFINDGIDTQALVDGLKENRILEELVIDDYSKNFTKSQFKLLMDGVNSSGVKKLRSHHTYNTFLCSYPLSRVVIQWYKDCDEVFLQWCPSQGLELHP